MSVTAIVPTYREATHAPAVVTALLDHGVDDVVVVDDSPTDRTARAIRDATPQADVDISRRRDADGLASAVLDGFAHADADTYVVCDGDGQHPPRAAAAIGQAVADDAADLVVGSRHTPSGSVADAWSMHRRIVSLGADSLARVAVPPARQLADPLSGLFAVDADVVDPAVGRLDPSGYKILLELLARCPIETVEEVGYEFQTSASASNLDRGEYVAFLRHLGRLSVPSRRQRLVDRVEVGAEASDATD